MSPFALFITAAFVSAGFLQFPAGFEVGAMSAVAIDAKDRIYVLHRGPRPLAQFDQNGRFVHAWGEGLFKVPHGLRMDRQGNLWVTDNGANNLRKFSPDGKLLLTLDSGFKSPDDLVFSSDGSMFVADAGSGRILKLSPDGKLITAWGAKGKARGEFAAAHGLAIDSRDRVYVADRGNNRVQVFSSNGQWIAEWSGFGNPYGLLVVQDQLLVTDGDAHRITQLSLDGKVAAQWGDPATLQLPHLMAIDSRGRLYVTEVNGKRVQIFEQIFKSAKGAVRAPKLVRKTRVTAADGSSVLRVFNNIGDN